MVDSTALLVVFALVVITEVFTVYVMPKLFARSRANRELNELESEIGALRIQSNTVNTPATFVAYAKIQRKLNILIPKRDAIRMYPSLDRTGLPVLCCDVMCCLVLM